MSYRNYKHVVECAGVALVNDGRIFLIRPFYNYRPQSYAIPKGHLEDGESSQECAKREFFEETGISLEGKKLEFLTYVYTKISVNSVKRVVVYKAEGNGNEKFRGANLTKSGAPENIYGEYIAYEAAKDVIAGYQIPIITKLMENEVSSFDKFYTRKLGF